MTMQMSWTSHRRDNDGICARPRRTVERNQTFTPSGQTKTEGRATADTCTQGADGYSVHSPHRGRLAPASQGTWLRQRRELLAQAQGLDQGRGLAGSASAFASGLGQGWANRPVAGNHRQPISPRSFWGDHTGPNPTDRGKKGCKRHVIVEAKGLPLVVHTTPANVHDSKPAMEMLDRIPPCAGDKGRPRSHPDVFQGDHAYGTPANLEGSAARGITPLMARLGERNTKHGSRLGTFRYVVERTFGWFGNDRRLRLCYERTGAHFQAFHDLAAALICARRLASQGGF